MYPFQRFSQALILAAAVLLAGCSQVSEQLADWLKPPSGAEMSSRIRDQAARGEVPEALLKGEAFVAMRPTDAGEVHKALSEIYLSSGDAVKAVQHMQKAISKGMSAPEAKATLSTSSSPITEVTPKPATPTAVQATADGASARVLPGGGVEVRAGGVSAKVQD
jgi:hypothetical protein